VGGGAYWLVWKFIVRLCIWERSGSCAANALKSTGAIFGMAGGSIFALAIAISFEQSISSPHCIVCYCCGSSISLLLILIGIVLQVNPKKCTHQWFFLHQIFFTHNNFHALQSNLCPLKHLNTALDGLLLLINMIDIILGWGISWDVMYVFIFSLVNTVPFVVSSIIIIMYKKRSKYYTTTLF
jgi:CBS domain containing-hemolysin-like protein